jgi:hypothetical protein
MRFGKLTMFFALQAIIVIILLFYFGVWMINDKTNATVVRPFYSNTINAAYKVDNETYTASYPRYDVPYTARSVNIRYLLFHPASSRINSFMGLAAEPLAWWFVFMLACSMLLLTHNTVFSKGTIFQIHKKFPWISMDEYFADEGSPRYYKRRTKQAKEEQKMLLDNTNKGTS